MNNTKLVSMEKLFHTLGYDYKTLKEDEWVDISDKNVKIKSFNHSDSKLEMRKILKLVRKKDSKVYHVKLKSGETLFRCTSGHKIYLEDKKKYEEIGKLKSFIGLNNVNQTVECLVEESSDITPILDLEVEGNNNYFSNGILSHNTTTTGGNALKFYASQRLELARKETLKKGDDAYGVKVRVKVVKNKVASPFTECYFDLIFKDGYDFEGSVVEEAVKYDFIQKGGAWFTYKGEKFQGLNGIKTHLKANPSLISDLRQQVLNKVKETGLSDKEISLEEETKRRVLLKEETPVESSPESIEIKQEEVNG